MSLLMPDASPEDLYEIAKNKANWSSGLWWELGDHPSAYLDLRDWANDAAQADSLDEVPDPPAPPVDEVVQAKRRFGFFPPKVDQSPKSGRPVEELPLPPQPMREDIREDHLAVPMSGVASVHSASEPLIPVGGVKPARQKKPRQSRQRRGQGQSSVGRRMKVFGVALLSATVLVGGGLVAIRVVGSGGVAQTGSAAQSGQSGQSGQLAQSGQGTPAGQGVVLSSGGKDFSCLAAGDTVTCVGANNLGQLGSTTPADHSFTVTLPNQVRLLASGEGFTCASTGVGVSCWGDNRWGQTTAPNHSTSVHEIAEFHGKKVSSMAAGVAHACAVVEGRAWCWGVNQVGQVGASPVSDTASVSEVAGLSGVIQAVTASDFSTCASNTQGQTWCWGNNINHVLSSADQTVLAPTPLAAPGPDGK